MKKVYIVYSTPDIIGIQVIRVYEKSSDAIEYCKMANCLYEHEYFDYFEQEVL